VRGGALATALDKRTLAPIRYRIVFRRLAAPVATPKYSNQHKRMRQSAAMQWRPRQRFSMGHSFGRFGCPWGDLVPLCRDLKGTKTADFGGRDDIVGRTPRGYLVAGFVLPGLSAWPEVAPRSFAGLLPRF